VEIMPPIQPAAIESRLGTAPWCRLLDAIVSELNPRQGPPVPVEMSVRIVRLGETTYTVAVVRDITDRLAAERALLESEEQYRTLFETANDAIFVVSDGSIADVNHKAVELFRRSREELVGTRPFQLSPERQPDGRPSETACKGYFSTAMQGEPQVFEWTYALPDGRMDAEVSLSRFESAGGAHVLAVVRDITERKRAQQQLADMNRRLESLVRERTKDLERKADELAQANERLRELDDMKSAFLSSVSHELRTPLTSVRGFARLISKDFRRHFESLTAGDGEDDERARKAERILANLDIIEHEGDRLTRLINDVLDVSKIESGRIVWQDQPLDVDSLVRDAAKAVSGLFAPKPGVRLEVDVAQDIPPLVADPDRIHQVLINLLSNAAKFTPQGTVRMSAEALPGGILKVSVADPGVGIAPEDQERVFEKFHQVEGAQDRLSTKNEGTGLGLTICRQIVEHYNGSIWVESAPDKGSTFTFHIPLR
jgi:PAS domain S-box-containing protein